MIRDYIEMSDDMCYVVILRETEDGYSISCPALPGCWSQGATKDEALSNIVDAIQGYLCSLDKEFAGEVAEPFSLDDVKDEELKGHLIEAEKNFSGFSLEEMASRCESEYETTYLLRSPLNRKLLFEAIERTERRGGGIPSEEVHKRLGISP